MLLDLDKIRTITKLTNYIYVLNVKDTIVKFIYLANIYGTKKSSGCYELGMKYLNNNLPICIEFDDDKNFVQFVYYNIDRTSTFLRIEISINGDPMIKYLFNDKSNYIPEYCSIDTHLRQSAYLMNFAHAIISFCGFNRISLDDSSLIYLDHYQDSKSALLWLYYLIKYNKSWYARFGYQTGNSYGNELDSIVSDVKNIKLDEISSFLAKMLKENGLENNPMLVEYTEELIQIINDSTETLYQYTISHSLENFAKLTNCMMKSVFEKNYVINNKNYQFEWKQKMDQMFIKNIIQVNNNINNYCYRLPSEDN